MNSMKDSDRLIHSVAFISGKGGTGKSIISASVAYVLAHCGFRTALLDLDLFTYGLTYYMLGDFPRKPRKGLVDVFMGRCEIEYLEPILIPDTFTSENLHLLPSSFSKRKLISELRIPDEYSCVETLIKRIKDCISYCRDVLKCEYAIIDSRGGTDHTSIAVALSSDSYVIITEADKPSWDIGRLLIETLENCESAESIERIGFIINKNVLPSEAIEAFLRKEWFCPHLCTIPLDETAVRCFQEDKVPVAVDIGCNFSWQVLSFVRKVFISEEWPEESRSKFYKLEHTSKTSSDEGKRSELRAIRLERINLIMRAYAAILSMMAIFILMYLQIRDNTKEQTEILLAIAIILVMLVFLMSFGDPSFTRKLLRIFILTRSKRDHYSLPDKSQHNEERD